jgi:hypothetical protein
MEELTGLTAFGGRGGHALFDGGELLLVGFERGERGTVPEEAGKRFLQKDLGGRHHAIDHPLTLALGFEEAEALHVVELFRDGHLFQCKRFDKMTAAKRPLAEKVKHPQPVFVGQALVKGCIIHLKYMHLEE